MDLFDLSPDQRETVQESCRLEGVDQSYASFVASHLDIADNGWRWCCGSSCDPCVNALGRAVDRARRALCLTPPGLPDADAPA